MRQGFLLVSVFLGLVACGASAPRTPQTDVAGVGGFLKKAFSEKAEVPVGGGLCGDPTIVGEVAGPVEGRIAGCGMEKAVRVTSVGGISLSQTSLVRCETALALKKWIEEGAQPALNSRTSKLVELKVAAHYSCRTRNNQPGAKISEHGKGLAIDLSAFRMSDGTEITVLDDWGRGKYAKSLREMHKAACGTFGTVLGPGSDAYHDDHFHFDLAQHRGGAYCR